MILLSGIIAAVIIIIPVTLVVLGLDRLGWIRIKVSLIIIGILICIRIVTVLFAYAVACKMNNTVVRYGPMEAPAGFIFARPMLDQGETFMESDTENPLAQPSPEGCHSGCQWFLSLPKVDFVEYLADPVPAKDVRRGITPVVRYRLNDDAGLECERLSASQFTPEQQKSCIIAEAGAMQSQYAVLTQGAWEELPQGGLAHTGQRIHMLGIELSVEDFFIIDWTTRRVIARNADVSMDLLGALGFLHSGLTFIHHWPCRSLSLGESAGMYWHARTFETLLGDD